MIALAAWFNESVVWFNMGGAAFATWSLFQASRGTAPRMRPLYAASCALAAIYTISYVWLGLNPDRSADWSEIMRPISMVTWWVVWTAPSRASLRLWKSRSV
jgi:hypothetical protein